MEIRRDRESYRVIVIMILNEIKYFLIPLLYYFNSLVQQRIIMRLSKSHLETLDILSCQINITVKFNTDRMYVEDLLETKLGRCMWLLTSVQ